MIFITLGSQKFQFDRLLKAIDGLNINEKMFAQIGYSTYKPQNYSYKTFLDREEFSQTMDKADIVITHGGTGAIISALKKGKKVIAVPRLSEYGEHVDNHQIQIVNQFKEMELIYGCYDMDLLKALKIVKETTYKKYESNTQKIIDSIEKFIDGK